MNTYRDRKGKYHKKPKEITSKKRESAYGIFIEDKKVLCVKPTWASLWEFPGGGKKEKESITDALKRELSEETGHELITYDKKPIQTMQTKFYADDLNKYFDSTMHFFTIKKMGTQNKDMINNKEIVEVAMVPIAHLTKSNTHNIHLEVLHQIAKR